MANKEKLLVVGNGMDDEMDHHLVESPERGEKQRLLAIGNGILTVENEEQALARADKTRKDKGGEAAKAAIAMMALKEQFGIG